jgi:phosphoserine aminotransferase
VIEKTAKQILDFILVQAFPFWKSPRAKDFQPVVDEAVALIKQLLDIPDGSSVIFLGGGASLQFMQIPANFLIKKAGYLNTGTWAKKALKEAKHFGEVVEVASSADNNYMSLPHDFSIPADLDYLHVCTNNTIYGTEYREDFDAPIPLIGDMSSDIMSRPVDVSKYTAIYAGAQKNMYGRCHRPHRQGIDAWQAPRELPTMIDTAHVEKGPCFQYSTCCPYLFCLRQCVG